MFQLYVLNLKPSVVWACSQFEVFPVWSMRRTLESPFVFLCVLIRIRQPSADTCWMTPGPSRHTFSAANPPRSWTGWWGGGEGRATGGFNEDLHPQTSRERRPGGPSEAARWWRWPPSAAAAIHDSQKPWHPFSWRVLTGCLPPLPLPPLLPLQSWLNWNFCWVCWLMESQNCVMFFFETCLRPSKNQKHQSQKI